MSQTEFRHCFRFALSLALLTYSNSAVVNRFLTLPFAQHFHFILPHLLFGRYLNFNLTDPLHVVTVSGVAQHS